LVRPQKGDDRKESLSSQTLFEFSSEPRTTRKNAGVVNTCITLHNLGRASLNLCKIRYFEKTFTTNGMLDFRHPPRRTCM